MVELMSLPGSLAALGTLFAMYVVQQFFNCYLLPRASSWKEKYPFQSTVELMRNNENILDWFCFVFFNRKKELGIDGDTIIMNTPIFPPMVCTNSVENVTHILKNIETYGKGGSFYKKMAPLLGEGIFNADGKQWFAHRKTSANLFKLEKFKTTMIGTFNEEMDTVCDIIRYSAKAGKVLEMQAIMAKLTLESIGRIALGVHLGCLKEDHVPFAQYFDYCTKEINDSFINPLWQVRRYLTPAGWTFFKNIKLLDQICFKIIGERRALLAENPEAFHGKSDLLSLYLDKDGDDDKTSDTYLEPSDRNLRDVVLNIFIAGRDTTANALSWSLYRLCKHPEVQAMVRQELTENKEGLLAEGGVSYQTLGKLRYLEAFCMEVLRLYPSVPKEAKNASKDDEMPDGTKVKKGDLVIFCPYVMGRDATLWEEPEKFDPTRFLDKPKPSPFVFTAFQAGPRICLGQNFAILEMKCSLARMLSQFEFSLAVPAESITYDVTLTLPVRTGLPIYAKESAI